MNKSTNKNDNKDNKDKKNKKNEKNESKKKDMGCQAVGRASVARHVLPNGGPTRALCFP